MTALYLASRSPRRRELLGWAGFAVDAHPSHADETRLPGQSPVDHVRRLASVKAATGPDDRVVLAADTTVHLGDATYEIPVDRAEAVGHLTALSGRWHAVTTGVCVRRGPLARVFAVTTEVRFRDLSAAEIAAYVASGHADDKAGAYGIQGAGGAFVAEVRGSYTNIVGLPLEAVLDVLRADFGVAP